MIVAIEYDAEYARPARFVVDDDPALAIDRTANFGASLVSSTVPATLAWRPAVCRSSLT